ncbi:hypothetical protein [uncultured Photobacterium sp.]|uniref:hypothetical protein n=1 Tax=uncultured Photobacterium sp. TaxID=173973 RepID=UPI002609C26A|nr:hypothetical protein [uncultured Photobacterium sp.]
MKEVVILLVTAVLAWALRSAIGFEYNLFSWPFDVVKALVSLGLFFVIYLAVSWIVDRIIVFEQTAQQTKP